MERHVTVPVIGAEFPKAFGYTDEDGKNVVVSPLFKRLIHRVKIVGYLREVYLPKNPDSKQYRKVIIWDGYNTVGITFEPALFNNIDSLKGMFVEVVGKPRINKRPDGKEVIEITVESIAPSTPEAFVLHKYFVLDAIKRTYGVESYEELKKMFETVQKLSQKYSGKKLLAYIDKHTKDKKKAEAYKKIAEAIEAIEYYEMLQSPPEDEDVEEEFEELE